MDLILLINPRKIADTPSILPFCPKNPLTNPLTRLTATDVNPGNLPLNPSNPVASNPIRILGNFRNLPNTDPVSKLDNALFRIPPILAPLLDTPCDKSLVNPVIKSLVTLSVSIDCCKPIIRPCPMKVPIAIITLEGDEIRIFPLICF